MAHRALRNCDTGVEWREHKLMGGREGGRELGEGAQRVGGWKEGKGERKREKERVNLTAVS